MLESLAAWVLNNYLGQYLENLNTDQLSVGLLSGAVEMENVPLRRDALASLDLPLRVAAGFVGRIRLSVPVRALGSQPWNITIEQLYVVLGPVRPEQMEADAEESAARQRAMRQLDAEEAAWRAEHEASQESGYYAASYSSWLSFGSSVVGNIIANLQLTIRDVHVRYEDAGFAAGVTIGALTAQSCDDRWVAGFVSESRDSQRFQLLELRQLAVYWDTNASLYADLSIGQLAEVMIAGAPHEFLLSPVTLQARLKRDCSERPLRSRSRPRHVLDLQCERLSLSLSDVQFKQAVQCVRDMEVLDRRRRYLRYRPDSSVSDAPAAWWRFAILTHRDRLSRRYGNRTWAAAAARAVEAVQYAAAYTAHLQCPATLTAEHRDTKARLEAAWEPESLAALRQWCQLQVQREETRRRQAGGGRGLLQAWFPLWTGWYGGEVGGAEAEAEIPELEQALDDMADSLHNSSALNRDAVLAQVNFNLQQAELKLLKAAGGHEESRALFALSLERVAAAGEWRARAASHLLQLSLGSLRLRDQTASGSAFPLLVAPQRRAPPGGALWRLMRLGSLLGGQQTEAEPPLFELLYERRPLNSKADHRLHVSSRALEVVYSPAALTLLRQFFSADASDAERLARIRYESLKRQTRAELRQTWEQLVEGEPGRRQLWDLMLNVSAPHIILPESLQDPSGLLMVLDFGHLRLNNDQFDEDEARRQAAAAADSPPADHQPPEEDDEFRTPCSTPPNEEQEEEEEPTMVESPSTDTISMATAGSAELASPVVTPDGAPVAAVRSELQKKMYDRFWLELSELQLLVGHVGDNWRQALAAGSSGLHLLDRFTLSLQLERRLLRSPELPQVALSGHLSHLMVHVSEPKVHALTALASRLLPADSAEDSDLEEATEEPFAEEATAGEPCSERTGDGPAGALLVGTFSTGQLSLAVQSRGRAVAELQVCGARGQLTRRRRQLGLSLSVHSLLLVDALQTYGPDFEILVASHRSVTVDSVSGSLLDSEPCSPCSPASPDPAAGRPPSPLSLSQAVSQRLQDAPPLRVVSPDPVQGPSPPPPPMPPEPGPVHAQDALITLEVSIELPPSGHAAQQTLRTVSVRFNTLDVVANQETIVELAGFVSRVSGAPPAGAESHAPAPVSLSELVPAEPLRGFSPLPEPGAGGSRTELTFDFHRLNVLLLRSVQERQLVMGRKVAVATVSGARVQATLAAEVSVTGALDGLQVRSLTPPGGRQPAVVSVGVDPVVEQSQDLLRRLNAGLYRSTERGARALQFSAERPAGGHLADSLRLRLASVCYTHSAPFLAELAGCVEEFRQYVAGLVQSVGQAAAAAAPQLELNVLLETPVVVVPESPGSRCVLVAHLGTIELSGQPRRQHRLEVRDMNLYSLDLDKVLRARDLSPQRAFSVLRADELYDARCCGDPILYDTALAVTLRHGQVEDPAGPAATRQALQLDGQFVTPVRLSVAKSQYEQILRTVQHLTTAPAEPAEPPAEAGEPSSLSTGEGDVGGAAPDASESKSSASREQAIPVHGSFQLSEFEMELRSDLGGGGGGGGTRSLVTLTLSDLSVAYERLRPELSRLQISLQAVTMEDLLQQPDAPHRYLLTSHSSVAERRPSVVGGFLSASCPDIASALDLGEEEEESETMPCGSLPARLQSAGVARPRPQPPPQRSHHERRCPPTPPGSPHRPSSPRPDAALIRCTATLRSGRAAAAAAARSVDLTFNCLDLVLSPQSWVMVLDFFGGPPHPEASASGEGSATRPGSPAVTPAAAAGEPQVTETLVQVRSLSVLLNAPGSGPLARVTVTDYSSRTVSGQERAATSGRLGALSLVDLTPYGSLYRERFVTSGAEAVHFDFVKYHSPDTQLRRACDAELRLQMASVLYVHTQRFVTELVQFFAHFTQLQDLLSSLRAASAGSDVSVSARGSRVSLDLSAGSPVLLLPLSAGSPRLLAADLGRLRVTNQFRMSGPELPHHPARDIPFSRRAAPRGRVSPVQRPTSPEATPCLLDVMQVSLSDMDVYSAQRVDALSPQAERPAPGDLVLGSYLVRRSAGGRLLRQKAELALTVERNLDAALSHDVSDLSVRGSLSTLQLSLDLPQYRLVRGLLDHNLGEPVGLEPTALIQPHHVQVAPPETVWLTMSVRLDLQNVSLELASPSGDAALARVHFIRSQLLYESFSDSSKDVDLMSSEIRLHDVRFNDLPANKRSNVFGLILQPLFQQSERSLQAELHYRASAEHAQFTVLLNSMRLMGVLDWWQTVNEFFSAGAEVAPPSEQAAVPAPAAVPGPSASMAVGAGVVTRRAALLGQPQQTLELKLNVSDCELVLVENPTLSDSAAVILKTTACVQYRPQSREKPLSCELQSCELFSCLLGGAEQETALSIVDPATVNVEVVGKQPGEGAARGILDATDAELQLHMEVLVQQLNVRVSYHDLKMFLSILESLPRQTGAGATRQPESTSQPPANMQAPLRQLRLLGFAEADCARALAACQGRLDDAAIWLTQHAAPSSEEAPPLELEPPAPSAFDLEGIRLHTSALSVCVIDDCGDADVPLLELSVSHLSVSHGRGGAGLASGLLSGDYYNRQLSGWEPFLEPFRCEVDWRRSAGLQSAATAGKLAVNVRSREQANVNVTSTLLQLYALVRDNWTDDYYNRHRAGGPRIASRRRAPFVPFSLKNDTGSRLRFRTVVTSFGGGQDPSLGPAEGPAGWTEVEADQTMPFTFGDRGKLRHQETHARRQHRLVVWVDGWQPAPPVSVDRVGVYFRQAPAAPGRHPSGAEQPPARVVFAVSLHGAARKLVTVRSALMLHNLLPDPVEVKMESAARLADGGLQVAAGARRPVPLALVHAAQQARPLGGGGGGWWACARPWRWWEADSGARRCRSWHAASLVYRFCVHIERDNYPQQEVPSYYRTAAAGGGSSLQPGHTITLLPPLTVVNLLPCELRFSITGAEAVHRVQPGRQACLVHVELGDELQLSLSVDGCRPERPLLLSSALESQPVAMRDARGRLLLLRARLRRGAAGWLRLRVTAPFWLVNRCGLPLVVAQETAEQTEAAGQDAEHERARSVAPLLFSLSDPEAPQTMVARLGRASADGTPRWCHPFHLQPGLHFRRLRVAARDTRRPDTVYVVGIETRPGRGRYSDTLIATVSPRFQIENRTSQRLLLSQLHLADASQEPAAQRSWLSAPPRALMPFHWPRHDRDHLLCVRPADNAECHWSGGFLIDRSDSFHLNLRDRDGLSRFLRVEVLPQGATFYVVVMEAEGMPAPFRVDNFSEVTITYHQSGAQHHHLRSAVRPRCSAPYAWDLPLARPHLTVVAPGGHAESFDMNQLSAPRPLHYDNFMFIAFTGTFGGGSGASFDPQNVECRQLVLDVVNGGVVLRRKEPGVRSQLWRHLPSGHLVHEGSSPPRDPRHPDQTSERMMVLDVAAPAVQPSALTALRLRQLDGRRRLTQTWRFTEDGRLCCQHPRLCVQAQDGFTGLRRGSAAVLGPTPATVPVPSEEAVQPQMQWPGSGQLSVRVVADGPTRVLQITDAQARPVFARLERDWVVVGEDHGSRLVAADAATEQQATSRDLTVCLRLPAGVGVSLVSAAPAAELLYLYLGDISAEYRAVAGREALDGSVRLLQADCQLPESAAPCALHLTPAPAGDQRRHLPAVCFAAHRLPSRSPRSQIFEHLVVSVRDLTLTIEERLLYHLLHLIGYSPDSSEVDQLEESDLETQRALRAATSSHNTRYYFRRLELALKKVRLSVLTSARLPAELAAVRDKFGRRLVQFEAAQVELDPFIRSHPFETAAKLLDSILEHYKRELKGQAAIILGSIDFLGNPLGFISDVSEGVSGLVLDGDVGGLVKSVTHGVANSTAKVTGSLSEAVGWATLDEKHDDSRRRIRSQQVARSEDHLLAGLKGFTLGLWGGASSLVVQPIQGASAEGVWGFFSGIGKGIVGTVTKPAVGILDLAAGAANAVRDTSSSSSRQAPARLRPIRVVQGAGGLLPRFSAQDGDGQELLLTITDRGPEERYVAYELLCPGESRPPEAAAAAHSALLNYGAGDLRVLVSSRAVRLLSHSSPGTFTLIRTVHFSELAECRPQIEREPAGGHLYQVVMTVCGGPGSVSQPALRCQDGDVAIKITELINFGKSCYEELTHTVPPRAAAPEWE